MSMLRNWNIMTSYDYVWYEQGIRNIIAHPGENAFGDCEIIGEDESQDLHLAFNQFVEQKRDFRPTENTRIRIRGWAVLDGNDQPIYDENGNIGADIMTSLVKSFFFKDDRLYVRTESGSVYVLRDWRESIMIKGRNRRKLKTLSREEVEEISNRYFVTAA